MSKNLEYLFNEVPLYPKEVFGVFNLENNKYILNNDEYERFKKYVGMGQKKIVTYCHKCKKEFPFNIERSYINIDRNLDSSNVIYISSGETHLSGTFINLEDGNMYGQRKEYDKTQLYNNRIYYIEYVFSCSNIYSHKYILMIAVEIKDGKFIVRKIGQNPSMLTIKGFDFDKYKEILEDIDAYDDYKKADLSNAEQFYVGAFAYLRRIFEKLVSLFLEGQTLKDNHMDTKIEAVKEYFDPRIRGLLKNLYGILSASIHELPEEQSKEYYICLKAVIDMQLEYMYLESEKDKQTKNLEGTINKIAGLVKGK